MRTPDGVHRAGTAVLASGAWSGELAKQAGFDTRPTLSGLVHLVNGAVDLLPALGRLPVDGVWGGLRLATPDRLPIIGWATDAEQLLLVTGHFRHGIILGPLTGHLVAQLLHGKTLDWDLAPYAPARFAAARAG